MALPTDTLRADKIIVVGGAVGKRRLIGFNSSKIVGENKCGFIVGIVIPIGPLVTRTEIACRIILRTLFHIGALTMALPGPLCSVGGAQDPRTNVIELQPQKMRYDMERCLCNDRGYPHIPPAYIRALVSNGFFIQHMQAHQK